MIFGPELARKIAAGTKTMTRRPIKPGQKECRCKIGHTYGVQSGRGKPSAHYFTVTDIREENVGRISSKDIRREGLRTHAEFFTYFERLYGPKPPKGTADPDAWWAERSQRLPLPALPARVHVISIVRGDHADQPRYLRATSPRTPTCTAMVTRIKDGEARKVKCGRGFEVDQESGQYKRCRCGARPPASDEDHYTTRSANAVRGEAEAIPAKIQDNYAKKAYDRDKRKREEMRQRALRAIKDVEPHATSSRERKRLRAAASQIRALGTGTDVAA